MQLDKKDTDIVPKINQIIFQTAFKHNDYKCDLRTMAVLYKNNLIDHFQIVFNDSIYVNLKNNDKKIINSKGPLFVENSKEPIVYKVADLIFTPECHNRNIIYETFLKLESGQEIGYITKQKINNLKEPLLSDNWVAASIEFFDIINMDWLCNLNGLQQAEEINNQNLINEFATKIFRPSVNSIESIGIGYVESENIHSSFKLTIKKIKNVSSLENRLNIFMYDFGHLPLSANYSIDRIINEFFNANPCKNQKKWKRLWKWADKNGSPISRYHICSYFINQTRQLAKSNLKKLYSELLNIVCYNDEKTDFEWSEAWKFRIDLAVIFGQLIESQTPGLNNERIYSQAWWISEKIASICSKDSQHIKSLRQNTLSSEQHRNQMVWQISTPSTVSSPIKYTTVKTVSSMWSISVLSRVDSNFLDYICQTELPDKDSLLNNISLGILEYLPINQLIKSDPTYAFENTCIKIAEYLSKNSKDIDLKNTYIHLIQLIDNLQNIEKVITKLKIIDTLEIDEQLYVAMAFRLLVHSTIHETKELTWDNFFETNWLINLLSRIDNIFVKETICLSLIELMHQKKDEWLYNLPHLFSIICEKHLNDKNNKDIAFMCIIICCICSETCSALKRILLYRKSEIEDSRLFWLEKLQEIYAYSSDYTRSKIRPVLLTLFSQ